MLDADKLLWYRREDREIRQPPDPPRRRQPKVARLQSPMQRRVSTQTSNPIRAMYGKESKYNQTPVAPEGAELTRNIGPHDLPQNDPGVGARPTQGIGYSRADRGQQRRRRGQTVNKQRTAAEWAELADQYDI